MEVTLLISKLFASIKGLNHKDLYPLYTQVYKQGGARINLALTK